MISRRSKPSYRKAEAKKIKERKKEKEGEERHRR
jgi:hypothetical protein